MKSSSKGLAFTKQFEGLKLSPYLDSVGIATIGHGTTFYEDGTKVTMNDSPITQDRADALLLITLNRLAASLDSCIDIDLNQNQTDALLDLTYNIGLGNFRKSTLLKLLNNEDLQAAANQILVWNKAGGKVIEGLSRRRKACRELFLS